MTTYEDAVGLLTSKGMVVLDNPDPTVPFTDRTPIPVRCKSNQHNYVWDMKFIRKQLQDKKDCDTLCWICYYRDLERTHAESICRRLHVELVSVSPDSKTYEYRLKCGHICSWTKKHLEVMDHSPYCIECIENRRAKQNPADRALIEKFRRKLRRLRKTNANFIPKVYDVLNFVDTRLTETGVSIHQVRFDDKDNDVWIGIECKNKNHHSAITLTYMLDLLKSVNLGSIVSVCHECCLMEH
jgi:hypothetical protein